MKEEYGICKGRYMTSDGYCAMSLEAGKKKISRCSQTECGLWRLPESENTELVHGELIVGYNEVKAPVRFITIKDPDNAECIINVEHIAMIEHDAITLPNTAILIESQEYERIKKLLEVQ